MDTSALDQRIADFFKQNPDIFRSYKKELDQFITDIKDVSLANEPFPHSLQPLFLSAKKAADIYYKLKIILNALIKVRREYFENPELRKYIGIPEDEARIISNDNRRDSIGHLRADTFLQPDGTIKLVEYNSDYPDGTFTDTKVLDYLQSLPHIKDIAQKLPNLGQLLIKSMISAFEKDGRNEKPVIGQFAPPDRWWLGEFYNFQKDMNEAGYETYTLNPERLEFDNGKLVCNGRRINIVRKGTEIFYFRKHYERLRPFFEAYKNNDFIVYNSFNDRLLGYKTLFAVLTDPTWVRLFNEEELKAIKECIPWTRRIHNNIDQDYLITHKDKLILKPAGGTEGHDIVIGERISLREWKDAIHKILGLVNNGLEWIAQEKVEITRRKLLYLDGENLKETELNYDLTCHILGHKDGYLEGPMYSRSSKSPVVNMSVGGMFHAVFVVKN